MKKIALFADVQNIYYTTQQAYRRQFNYTRLWQRVSAQGQIIQAHAYAIDRDDDQQRKFQYALGQIGFDIKLKPYIQRSDGSAKGDWDVGITIDILEAAKNVDHVTLLSGDGDFDILIKTIREKYSVFAEVFGVPSLTAQSLIQAASIFHPIDNDLLL